MQPTPHSELTSRAPLEKVDYADTLNRRERIMQAAKRIMAEVGYERATTADIAHEAGTTETELLSQFGDKHSLLESMFNAVWEPLNSRIADIVMASFNARQAAVGILSAMLHVLGRDADLARLLLFESRRQHGNNGEIRLSRGFRDFETLLLRVVERGQKDGSFSGKLEAPAVASALLGAAEGMVRDRMLGEMLHRPVPFNETHLRLTFEAVVAGLAP
jgi:AcrR family transcriptional regulator